jgi:hypothetical protein
VDGRQEKTVTDAIDRQNKEFEAVRGLAEQYRRITLTPIVDDDYPEVRFAYDQAVRTFIDALKVNRPELLRRAAS